MKSPEKVALFDLDGTLCDYDLHLYNSLQPMQSPTDTPLTQPLMHKSRPDWIKARCEAVQSTSEWWATIPELKLGFDIWNEAGAIGFDRVVLTQGPRVYPHAWLGKKLWIDMHLGADTSLTITRDKGLVYGRVLVDDYPEYILRWLTWRPRGLVIMPSSPTNEKFVHPQVIRYDGWNFLKVQEALAEAFERG